MSTFGKLKIYRAYVGALKVASVQVPGWRLEKTDQGSLCLRQEWKVKDSRSGDELMKRIGDVAEAEGHRPEMHMKEDSAVAAELSTHAIGMRHHLHHVKKHRKCFRPVTAGIRMCI